MEGMADLTGGAVRMRPKIRLYTASAQQTLLDAVIITTHHIMTGPVYQAHQNIPNETSRSKFLRAMENRHGVRNDLEALCKFVRETLFYAMIHEARGAGTNPNDEIMGENGKACMIFIHVFMRDKEKISNIELVDSTEEEKEHYLKFLWKEGLQTKGKYNIRRALSNEKSAVYAGIAESFKSKLCVMLAMIVGAEKLTLLPLWSCFIRKN
jgi:hypothetical protein